MLLPKLWLVILLLIICHADIRQMIIPDICVLLMLPAALFGKSSWQSRILAAAAPWLAFLLMAALSAAFRKSTPMGMGDIKLFSAIGLISGLSGLVSAAVTSSVLGGLAAATLLILKKVQKKDQIAFGPFIAVGYTVYLASVSAI